MAHFISKRYANQEIVFAHVGPIKLDVNGVFEVTNEQLIKELKGNRTFHPFVSPAPQLAAEPEQTERKGRNRGKAESAKNEASADNKKENE